MSAGRKPPDGAKQARAAHLRARVLAEIPSAVPLIRALHAEGLIEGWRALTYVGPPRELSSAVCGPFLRGDELMRKEE